MRTLAASSATVTAALGLALLVAGAATARSQATSITVGTTLDAAQEVPAPSGNVAGARGTFTARVTRSTMTWRLNFAEMTGPVGAAHVHTGARGVAGPVSVPLCSPCSSPASGTADIDASVLSAIQTGRAYTNLHTAANAAGEIRGQLAVVATVRTALNVRQEVPRPTGTLARAGGTFTAAVSKSGATGTAAWRLSFSRLTGRAVAAHIHLGRPGRAGPVAVALCGPCRNGVRGSATLRAPVLAALEAGRAYVNVHTARNPGGEIRGQIAAVPLRVT
jgi:CHRD domain